MQSAPMLQSNGIEIESIEVFWVVLPVARLFNAQAESVFQQRPEDGRVAADHDQP